VYLCNVVVEVGGKNGKLMADQIVTADKKRLKKIIGVLSADDMEKVEDTVRTHLGL
jgi:mRNA-degrading endonuclease toxin of MazEF toxin-antitoxin module